MKATYLVMACLVTVTFGRTALADPVSATAELARLTELVEQGNQQIKSLRDSMSIQKQLAQMEQLKVVQKVAGFGEEAYGLVLAIEDTQRLIESFETIDDEFYDLIGDIDDYYGMYESAANEDEFLRAMKGYARALKELDDQYWTGTPYPSGDGSYDRNYGTSGIYYSSAREETFAAFWHRLKDFQRLQILKDAQHDNSQAIARGLSEDDATRVATSDTNMMLQLAISREDRELTEAAQQLEADEVQREVFRTIMGIK